MYKNLTRSFKKVISTLLASTLIVTAIPSFQADAAMASGSFNITKKTLLKDKSFHLTIKKAKKNASISWKVADKDIVTLTPIQKNKKKVTAKKAGATKVTATIKQKGKTVRKLVCNIVVVKKASNLSITPTKGNKYNYVYINSKRALTAEVTSAADKDYVTKWKSSDTKIAAVKRTSKNKANVSGLKPGTVTITATTFGGKTTTIKLTVKKKSETPKLTATPTITAAPMITETPPVTEIPVIPTVSVLPTTDAPILTGTPVVTELPPITDVPVITDIPIATAAPTVAPASPVVPTTSTPNAVEAPLEIVSVSAISPTKVMVTLNRTVNAASISANQVVVMQSDTQDKNAVTSVAAGKTADCVVIGLASPLTTAKSYLLALEAEATMLTNNFIYTVGIPTTIVAENQSIPFDVASNLTYTVYDENGLDITELVQISISADKPLALNNGQAEGKQMKLSKADKDALVTLTATLGDITITSQQFTVTGETPVASELINYTLAMTTPDFSAENYQQDLSVYMNGDRKTLYIQFKDQFGTIMDPKDMIIEYEAIYNTTTIPAIIDKASGMITPLQIGTVPIKISIFNTDGLLVCTKTIQLTIQDKAKSQALKTNTDALSIYKGLANKSVTTDVWLEDQYGKRDTNIEVESTPVVGLTDVTAKIEAGVLTFTLGENATLGTGSFTFTVDGFTKTVNITVNKLGAMTGYDVANFKTILDKNTVVDTLADKMNLTVSPIDANGNVVGDKVKFSILITENGAPVFEKNAIESCNIEIGKNNIELDKTYTLMIAVNNSTIKTFTFYTTDSKNKPALTIASKALINNINSLTDTTALAKALQAQNTLSIADGWTLSNLTFITTNSNTLTYNTSTGKITFADGSVDVILQNVTATKDAQQHIIPLKNRRLTIQITANQQASACRASLDAVKNTVNNYYTAINYFSYLSQNEQINALKNLTGINTALMDNPDIEIKNITRDASSNLYYVTLSSKTYPTITDTVSMRIDTIWPTT